MLIKVSDFINLLFFRNIYVNILEGGNVMVKIFNTYGEFVRNTGIVLMYLFAAYFVIVVFSVMSDDGMHILAFINGLFNGWHSMVGNLGIGLLLSGIILYILPLFFYHVDYHNVDFGLFSTEIHDSFKVDVDDPFIASLSNGIKLKFVFTGKYNDRTYTNQTITGGGRYVRRSRETVYATDFFSVTFISFNSQKQRLASQDTILKDIKDTDNPSSTKHYSSDNVLIVFQCYSVGKGLRGAYPFSKSLVTRKAVKNVRLNSQDEIKKHIIKFKERREQKNREYAALEELRKSLFGKLNEQFMSGVTFQSTKSLADLIIEKEINPEEDTRIDVSDNADSKIEEKAKDDFKTTDSKIDEIEEKEKDDLENTPLSIAMDAESDIMQVHEALEKITDEKDLIEIGRYSQNMFARGFALRRIKDQNALAEILIHSDNSAIIDLVEKVYDQRLLCEIAKEAMDDEIRRCAFEKITDEKLREEVINYKL